MGLGGFVHCNCLREGKISTSPVPIDDIYIDEDGNVVCKSILESDKDYIERITAFEKWVWTCCEHKDMYYCHEHVGNISSTSNFYWFTSQLPETQYPYIYELAELMNNKPVPSEKSALILSEFLKLEKIFPEIRLCTLIDIETNDIIQERVEMFNGAYAFWDDVYEMGISSTGLFVRNRETKEILFQAMRVRQTLLCSDPQKEETLLEDLDNPAQKITIHRNFPDEKPITMMEVQMRPLTVDDLYSFAPLKSLLQASIETGNPIFWC